MKALIIGLGGAGSRIADILYDHDRRSGTHSIEAIAIDTDITSIKELRFIPHTQRIVLPSLNNEKHGIDSEILDIAEMVGHIQQCNSIEIDSVIICTGLGGMHADAISLIINKIRDSFFEPVFCILTLPMRSEGAKISARAADQIEMIEPLVDGCILFDNDTWYRKIATEMLRLERTKKGGEDSQIAEGEEAPPDGVPLNPRERNSLLNEQLARRVGLILRAGEFVAGGKPVAEVVLDAGEVLNTIKGMGMAAIGYATEIIPKQNLGFFRRFKKEYTPFEDGHKRASRIVELAKRAIYQEISIPCDLTSAKKALILIAGPSDELSMKGFQNVRRWIDRSISGLEMRAGDYPVLSTKYVGVIILLAGLENIPRVNELKEIRHTYNEEQREKREEQRALSQEREELQREREELERKARERAERAALLQQEEIWAEERELPIIQERERYQEEKRPMPTPPAAPQQTVEREEQVWEEIPLPGRGEAKEETILSLPRRSSIEVADISRQTMIEGPIRPNDRSMDPGSVRMKEMPTEQRRHQVAQSDGSFSLPSMVRARDGSFEAKAIALKSHFQRPRDQASDGEEVLMRSSSSHPRDDALMGRGTIRGERSIRPDDSAYIGRSASLNIGRQPTPKESIGGDLIGQEMKGSPGYQDIADPKRSRDEEEEEDSGITWI
jgi:cell division GTPase FtsZ